MRALLATLMLVSTASIAASAEHDRYAGRYSADCAPLVCELDVAPIRGGWTVRWIASDPRVLDAKPRCAFTTTAAIGSAEMGAVGTVTGIAVGEWRGRPFGIFDLEPGRVSWSSSWEACPGISPKAVYSAFGDE